MPSQALIDAMMAGQPAASVNRQEQSRLLLSMLPSNMPAPSPEEETLHNMSPVDALKFSRDLQNRRQYSPDEAAANRAQTAEDLAYVTPVLGNALSARDAYRYGREAATTPDETDAHKNMAMAGLSTLGAMTGLPFGRTAAQVAREAPDTLPAILAYHGSPHDFDQFKLDKIGTGEGAQAYGHGLYFAENPAVAKSYRDTLALNNQRPAPPQPTNPNNPFFGTPILEQDPTRPGRLYKAELDVEPEHLLDWDKPLGEQSPQVRAAVQKASKEHGVEAYGDLPPTRDYEAQFRDPLVNALPRPFNSRVYAENALSDNPTFDPIAATREAAPERLPEVQAIMDRFRAAKGAEAATGHKWWQAFVGDERDPQRASQRLREAGIPGIKYLDQGSRGSGQGTSNYVIFDDNLVKILGKE